MVSADASPTPSPWATPAALCRAVGRELPPTRWRPVTRTMIRRYATLTGDDQPIHGAGHAAGPEVIAQGALLVGLAAGLLQGLYPLPWAAELLQAGYDDLRIRSAVVAGERIRLHGRPQRFRALGRGRYWLETRARMEREGHTRPVLTGRFLSMIVEDSGP